MSSHNNFKISSAAYKGIFKILIEFTEVVGGHKTFETLIINITEKLKQHDIDKTVKKSVMKCAGAILEQLFEKVKEFRQNELLEAINEKLKIEIEKGYILKQLTRIKVVMPVKNSLIQVLTEILHKVTESLGSNNYDLNIQAMSSTTKLIEILDKNIDKKTVSEILNKSKTLILESNIPRYIPVLMQKYPAEFKQYAEILIKTADV
jgi:hypothetical protein